MTKEKITVSISFYRLKWYILAMCFIVFSSNILVNVFIAGLDNNVLLSGLTYGAVTFPIAFLVTDTVNRIHGSMAARKVVLFGFIAGITSSWFFGGTDILNIIFGIELYEPRAVREFLSIKLMNFQWIAIASGSAFFISQMLDIFIFNKLRKQAWWKAPVFSSLISSAIDKIIFFFIAFSGISGLSWISMARADWLAAIMMTILLLPIYRIIIDRIQHYKSKSL